MIHSPLTKLVDGNQRNMKTLSTLATPLAWEHWADWMTVAIAGKARQLYPDDIKARAAWFDAQIDALPNLWKPKYRPLWRRDSDQYLVSGAAK